MARPELHVTPARGWLNDAHGVAHHGGRYHLFHQAVPDAVGWRPDLSWGHLTSPDLVSWTARPPALAPGDGDLGCWSGDLLRPPDGPETLFYTAVTPPDLGLGAVRVARPVDADWTAWRKGPVVVRPPRDAGVIMFRDPTVVPDDGGWRMLVGAGLAGGRAAVLSFVSDDLETWQPDGVLADRPAGRTDPVWTGEGWECPHLVAVGDRHVLVVSVWDTVHGGRYVAAASGHLRAGRFVAGRWQRLTYGPAPFAATTFADADGRPCLIFWWREVADPSAGWAGALSVPYRVAVGADDGVRLAPHPAVRSARPAHAVGLTWGDGTGPPAGRLGLRSAAGDLVAELVAAGQVLRVTVVAAATGPVTDELPLGDAPVDVLADGPVLAIASGAGLFGRALVTAAVSADGDRGSCRAWWT